MRALCVTATSVERGQSTRDTGPRLHRCDKPCGLRCTVKLVSHLAAVPSSHLPDLKLPDPRFDGQKCHYYGTVVSFFAMRVFTAHRALKVETISSRRGTLIGIAGRIGGLAGRNIAARLLSMNRPLPSASVGTVSSKPSEQSFLGMFHVKHAHTTIFRRTSRNRF